MSVYEALKELKSISGTKAKLARFEELLMDVPFLDTVFRLALSSEINYGIKKAPSYEKQETCLSLSDALRVLELRFAMNEVTGNARIDEFAEILSKLSEDDAKVAIMIVQKKLDCGISVTNANKVLQVKIPTFNVMLCAKNEEKTLSKMTFPAIAQTKSDGLRIIVSVDYNGNVKYRTRNGKELEALSVFDPMFRTKPGLVFDGEALVLDDVGTVLDRKTGNGILNSIRQGKASPEDIKRVHFVFWDLVMYDDFMAGYSITPYEMRFADLLRLDFANFASVQKGGVVANIDEAMKFYEEQRALGEEGIILKRMDAPYEAKRVNHQIKFKAEETADLRICLVVDGTGKNENRLGNLICRTADDKLEVGVGTGFSDEQRQWFWDNADTLVGKIVEVKYNEVIQSKGNEMASLFLPVFVELRIDKDQANTLEELK